MTTNPSRRGQSLVGFLLAFPMIVGALGLTVDLGWSYFRQESAKSAAQAAAIAATAAAGSTSSGNPVCGSNNVVCQSPTRSPASIPNPAVTNIDVACQYAKDNGFAYTSGGTQNVMVAAGTGTPTGLTGITVPYWVQVTVAENVTQTFSAVFGSRLGTISARSTSGYMKPAGGCIYVLGSPGTTVAMSGTPSLSTGCSIYVNSTSSAAMLLSGSPSITVTGGGSIDVSGAILRSGSPTFSPSPNLGTTPVADPLSGLTPPVASGCSVSGVSLSGSSTKTLSPCVAGGIVTVTSGISLSGSASVTLDPGIYIMNGGISASGSATINGSGGVMIYMASGGISLSGGTTVNITAPSSGPYQGIGIYQPSSNTTAMALSGGSSQSINGAVYAPGASLAYSGSSGMCGNGGGTTLVINSITFSGSSSITQPAKTAYSGSSGPTLIE
jgi:hypothetical protein